VHTSYLLPDCTVVVELATSSGLALTDRTQPLRTYTRGFEVAIAAALDRGADRPLLAIGGSSATDVSTSGCALRTRPSATRTSKTACLPR
jgi:glycerate kinase